jgi:hypothetical protein
VAGVSPEEHHLGFQTPVVQKAVEEEAAQKETEAAVAVRNPVAEAAAAVRNPVAEAAAAVQKPTAAAELVVAARTGHQEPFSNSTPDCSDCSTPEHRQQPMSYWDPGR